MPGSSEWCQMKNQRVSIPQSLRVQTAIFSELLVIMVWSSPHRLSFWVHHQEGLQLRSSGGMMFLLQVKLVVDPWRCARAHGFWIFLESNDFFWVVMIWTSTPSFLMVWVCLDICLVFHQDGRKNFKITSFSLPNLAWYIYLHLIDFYGDEVKYTIDGYRWMLWLVFVTLVMVDSASFPQGISENANWVDFSTFLRVTIVHIHRGGRSGCPCHHTMNPTKSFRNQIPYCELVYLRQFWQLLCRVNVCKLKVTGRFP